MRLKLVLSFLSCCYVLSGLAQQVAYNQQDNFLNANSYWVLSGMDVNFNVNPPSVTSNDSSTSIFEGCASVADPLTGELLFYSDGTQVRNRNNEIMPNGDSLFGNGGLYMTAGSTTQGVCIVPMIDSPGKYYLFSMNGITDGLDFPGGGSLLYSVVDMNLESNLGDVVSNRKNIVLDTDTLSESMIAIPGNNCDIWLMVHNGIPSEFKAYHITREGINPSPVVSQVGNDLLPNASASMGGMTISPNRERLAISLHFPLCYGYVDSMTGVLLCDFDPETGMVSNAIQIEKDMQAYVTAFSPDNSKLYVGHYEHLTDSVFIQQYDITSNDPAVINASKQKIAAVFSPYPYLKLYRDTLYLTDMDPASVQDGLSTINQPNLSGVLCGFQRGTIPGAGGIALPNEAVYPIPPDLVARVVMDTSICSGTSSVLLLPEMISAGYEYTWNGGSSDTFLRVDEIGTYWVSYTNGCHQYTDSFKLQYRDFMVPVITVDGFRLGTTGSYLSYQWLFNGVPIPDATGSSYDVTENGKYQVIVNDGTCTDTSAVYEVSNTSIHVINPLADQVIIYPNPAKDRLYIDAPTQVKALIYGPDGRLIKAVENAAELTISTLSAGMYYLHVTDQDGVLIKVEKVVRLGSD